MAATEGGGVVVVTDGALVGAAKDVGAGVGAGFELDITKKEDDFLAGVACGGAFDDGGILSEVGAGLYTGAGVGVVVVVDGWVYV